MDIIGKIDLLMKERGWTDYRLATESGLSSSTIANMHRRNTIPSIPTLETICKAFGITLSQFFDEGMHTVHLNTEQQRLFDKWMGLTEQQKDLVMLLIDELR